MSSFYDTLVANGFLPKTVLPDGKFYRCATTDKPNRKNGAYILQLSGRRGYFHNYATDDGWSEWRDDAPMTVAEKRQVAEETEKFKREEAAKKRRLVEGMRAKFANLAPLRHGHIYLEKKGLTMQGCGHLRIDGDNLVIPIGKDGELRTLQTITPDGGKKYQYGCSISGAYFRLRREGATVTCLAEGFATGLAVYQSLPFVNVIVAFDAGNLAAVAKNLNIKGMCVVCADNDWRLEERYKEFLETEVGAFAPIDGLSHDFDGVYVRASWEKDEFGDSYIKAELSGRVTRRREFKNMGVFKAQEAAKAIGCGLAIPVGIDGTDWADALIEWGESGITRLRGEIMRRVQLVI